MWIQFEEYVYIEFWIDIIIIMRIIIVFLLLINFMRGC